MRRRVVTQEKNNKEKKINKKYKDSVFTDLFFEDEKAKERELELYNALFDTDYKMEDVDIEKICVDDVVYMKLKNDVSFGMNNRVVVFCEHQSTINGNMPLRDLLYVARTYEKIIPVKERYRRYTVKIPRPEFFVFYNGQADQKVEFTQKLSDAYLDNDDSANVSLELTVKVININTKAGNELLKKCKVLEEYSKFVEKVWEYRNKGVEDYMKEAIRYCIKHHILEEYLLRKGSEVVNFLCAEYDYEMDLQVHEEEAYKDGIKRGREEGIQQGIRAIIKDSIADKKEKKEILEKLIMYFSLTETEAENMFEKYSNH